MAGAKELRVEGIGATALTLIGIGLSVVGTPRWAGFVFIGAGVVLGAYAVWRWQHRPPTAAAIPAPPRPGIDTPGEHTSVTKSPSGSEYIEHRTFEVSRNVHPPAGEGTASGVSPAVPEEDKL